MTDQPIQPVEGERPMSEREQVERNWGWGRYDGATAEYRDQEERPDGIGWFKVNWIWRQVSADLQSQRKLTEEAEARLEVVERTRAAEARAAHNAEVRAKEAEHRAESLQRQVDEYREGLTTCEDAISRFLRAAIPSNRDRNEIQALGVARRKARSLLAAATQSPESNDG